MKEGKIYYIYFFIKDPQHSLEVLGSDCLSKCLQFFRLQPFHLRIELNNGLVRIRTTMLCNGTSATIPWKDGSTMWIARELRVSWGWSKLKCAVKPLISWLTLHRSRVHTNCSTTMANVCELWDWGMCWILQLTVAEGTRERLRGIIYVFCQICSYNLSRDVSISWCC